jgi:hypothetical protein
LQPVGIGLPGLPGFFGATFGFTTFFAIPVSFVPAGARRRARSALETRAVDHGG